MALEHGTTSSELRHLSARLGVSAAAATFLDDIASAICVAAPPIHVGVLSQGSPTEDDDAAEASQALHGLPPAIFVDIAPDVVWVVARDVVVPRTCRDLMAADREHLPIVISRTTITVGPVITPGLSACTSCLAMYETQRDPMWPALASQLVTRRGEALGAAIWGEIARTAMRLMLMPRTAKTVSYQLSATHPPRARQYRPHEDCGCQFPGESAMASDAGALRHAPTTTTMTARLA